MTTRPFAALGAVAVLALAPAAALAHSRFSHTVVFYRSIAGVRLKSTPAEIEKRFGKPSAVFRSAGKIDSVQYNAIEMQIYFDTYEKGDPAMLIDTNGSGFHAIKGIRIGTTRKTLEHRLHGFPYLRCSGSGCSISRGGKPGSPGSSITTFDIEGGKVAGFGVGYNYPE